MPHIEPPGDHLTFRPGKGVVTVSNEQQPEVTLEERDAEVSWHIQHCRICQRRLALANSHALAHIQFGLTEEDAER